MPNNRVSANRNRRKGNGQAAGPLRRNKSDRHKPPSVLESYLLGTAFGGFLNQIWKLLVNTYKNLDKVQNNDELMRQTRNEGRLQRKQENYEVQYYQLSVWLMISRFLSVIVISTVFVPDEYYQGTEVAHWLVYGKGHLTWEWTYGLRGFLYPCFVALPMWIWEYFKWDLPSLMTLGPRLLQAAVTCLAEYKFIRYVRHKFGNESGLIVYGLLVTNWFVIFNCSRTLTNTMEMDLNLLAFYYLQYDYMGMFTALASLAFFVRPTAIVIWIPISFYILSKISRNAPALIHCFTTGTFLLYGNTLLDIRFYKKFVLPPWKFFQFNFLEGRSSEFGTHPFLWYFYSALPSIFGPLVIWILLGFLYWPSKYSQHLKISLTYLIVFSVLGHKEIRFLLPIIPHLLVVAGDCISCMQQTAKNLKLGVWKYLKALLYINLIAHLGAVAFFGQLHQVGIKRATNDIRSDSRMTNLNNPNIWILMPCYSVPVYTYLHFDHANYEYLTCSPPGINSTSPNSQDVDFSEFNFKQFIESKLANAAIDTARPDYVMTYGPQSFEITTVFKHFGLDYEVMGKYYHTVLPFDNVGKYVLVLRLNGTNLNSPSSRERAATPTDI